MKIEKEKNRVLFISENEEEQKLLTNYGYAVTPRDIKLARILYYNDKSNEPIVFEARCNLRVQMLLQISRYLYNKKAIGLLKEAGLPYPDSKPSKHPQKIIHVDFKTGKVFKPYEDLEW